LTLLPALSSRRPKDPRVPATRLAVPAQPLEGAVVLPLDQGVERRDHDHPQHPCRDVELQATDTFEAPAREPAKLVGCRCVFGEVGLEFRGRVLISGAVTGRSKCTRSAIMPTTSPQIPTARAQVDGCAPGTASGSLVAAVVVRLLVALVAAAGIVLGIVVGIDRAFFSGSAGMSPPPTAKAPETALFAS
jgi:hypothetical protein